MLTRLFFCLLYLALNASILLAQNNNPIVRFQTELGNIDVVLLQDVAPNTVANFLNYQSRGAYDGSFIHRSPPNFVVQGGGYKYVSGNVYTIPTDPPVANEFHVSNTRGTLAMAKLAGNPNSATSQWFFNESDNNAPNLDTQNGGFTVFGRIIGSAGLSVMDAIAAVPIYNFGSPFDQLPLRNYTGTVQDSNFVHVISLTVFRAMIAVTRPSANAVHLQGLTTPSAAYRLETSTTPNAAGFTLATMVNADASGNVPYDDPSPGTKKFYRFVLP
ncbi:MAG: peptidylprolyl isomerase [Verrucomicrobiota bacterium]|nr:peptidylprolyl isomerase [Verrucomicrobiota bacterium]